MRLPKDKAERTKVLVLAAIGVVAVGYGLIFGIGRPLLTKRKQTTEDIQNLKDELFKARVRIDQMGRLKADNLTAILEISSIAEKYILRSRHGNYLIEAKKALETAAAGTDMEFVSVDEIGEASMTYENNPAAAPDEESDDVLKSYTAQATLKGDFFEFTKMMQLLENNNPYLCVSNIDIEADPQNPLKHRIGLLIQWPIWANRGMHEELQTQLSEAQSADKRDET